MQNSQDLRLRMITVPFAAKPYQPIVPTQLLLASSPSVESTFHSSPCPKPKMAAASTIIAAAATIPEPLTPLPIPALPRVEHPKQHGIRHKHPSPPLSLVPPSTRHRRRRPSRVVRFFRSLCHTLPIFTPKCKLPTCRIFGPCSTPVAPSIYSACTSPIAAYPRHRSLNLITGTLFGNRRGRVSFAIQENPGCLPSLVVELPLQTQSLVREMSAGMVRIALECVKKPASAGLLEESMWTVFCNGKKSGYGIRREATEEDLAVMETLRAVATGAGVIPAKTKAEVEMAYFRAGFEHVIGSKDSETLYMMSPEDGQGPDLTIFFVRL